MAAGRDDGKVFLIKEFSAVRAEKWAMRMFIALKGTGAEIPIESQSLGMVGIAYAGLNAFLRADVKPEIVEALMVEMMECVSLVRDPRHPDVVTPIVSDDDIEEVRTLLWLRGEIVRLHTGFSLAEALSTLAAAAQGPKV